MRAAVVDICVSAVAAVFACDRCVSHRFVPPMFLGNVQVEFEPAKDAASASPAVSAAASGQAPLSEFDLADSMPSSSPLVFSAPPLPALASATSPVLTRPASALGSPKKESYFAKLGSGQRVNGKPVAASSPPFMAMSSSAAAAPPLAPLQRAHSAPDPSTSASARTVAGATAAGGSSSSGSAPSSPAADLPVTHSLNSAGNRVVHVVEGGFRYVYEITKGDHKRLLRREKLPESLPRPASAAGGHSLLPAKK